MSSEPIVSQFTGAIEAVIDQYRDQGITIAEVLGAMDLIHAQIIKDAMEGEGDDQPITKT